jgi:hypothetical protein
MLRTIRSAESVAARRAAASPLSLAAALVVAIAVIAGIFSPMLAPATSHAYDSPHTPDTGATRYAPAAARATARSLDARVFDLPVNVSRPRTSSAVRVLATEGGGDIGSANFAQTTASNSFSAGGSFSGQTIGDVADGLRSGALSAADVPVQVIERDGSALILNTRSALEPPRVL